MTEPLVVVSSRATVTLITPLLCLRTRRVEAHPRRREQSIRPEAGIVQAGPADLVLPDVAPETTVAQILCARLRVDEEVRVDGVGDVEGKGLVGSRGSQHGAMVRPAPWKKGGRGGEADDGVLGAELRDGVVAVVDAVDEVHVGRPGVDGAGVVDLRGHGGQDGANVLPVAGQGAFGRRTPNG